MFNSFLQRVLIFLQEERNAREEGVMFDNSSVSAIMQSNPLFS